MKLTKFLIAASLFCLALVFFMTPAVNVGAQDATATPAIVILTATPNTPGSTAGGAAGTPAAGAGGPVTDASGKEIPREIRALRAARTTLSKKLLQRIDYVKAWTWELLLFKDSALGCPTEGQTVIPGDAAGYLITITTFDGKQYELHVTYELDKVYYCNTVGGNATGANPITSVGPIALGGSFEAGAQILDFGQRTVADLKAAKMKWIKVQITPNDYSDKAKADAAHAQGLKILFSVKGSRDEVLGAGFNDRYATYVGVVAKDGADAIEIWNEQNIDREWPSGHIDPALYTQLLSKSFAAIKANNPNTIVISGALAPTGFFGAGGKADAGWNDDVYYQGMAAAGAAQYMDCVGLHYNEGIISPTQGSGDPRGGYPTYYFDSMLNRAIAPFGGKPGCYTELGYLTPQGYGALPAGFAWAKDTTVAQQAQWLAEAASKAAASGKVRLMIVFNMDFVLFSGSDPQAGYAMIRPDGTCPACASLAAVLP
ncbi:MAG: hypothetical protein ABI947_15670 [Chloroflexota bacterium]